MKRLSLFTGVILMMAVMIWGAGYAQEQQTEQNKTQHGLGFVDENGDGYNDNAPDHDGDGIPNGQDPDWVRQNTGKGRGAGGFVDENGDGLNDWAQDFDGDGIPNGQDPDYVRPEDGTGRKLGHGMRRGGLGDGTWKHGSQFGGTRGSGSGSGTCDGMGPKGAGGRRGK